MNELFISDIIKRVNDLISGYKIPKTDIYSIISNELSGLSNRLGIKIIDSYDDMNAGFYLYNIDGSPIILKVSDSESSSMKIDKEKLTDLLVFSYAGRFISWLEFADLNAIKIFTKKVEGILLGL